MLSIAIYSNNNDNVALLKSAIQDFLIEHRIMAKVCHFQKSEEMILVPLRYDAYIIDMDTEEDAIALGTTMREIDIGSHFIYMSFDTSKAYIAYKFHADYFLEKPIDIQELNFILNAIK